MSQTEQDDRENAQLHLRISELEKDREQSRQARERQAVELTAARERFDALTSRIREIRDELIGGGPYPTFDQLVDGLSAALRI